MAVKDFGEPVGFWLSDRLPGASAGNQICHRQQPAHGNDARVRQRKYDKANGSSGMSEMTYPVGPTSPAAFVGARESLRATRLTTDAAATPATTTPAAPAGSPKSPSTVQAAVNTPAAHELSRSQVGPHRPAGGSAARDAAMVPTALAGGAK